MIHDMCLEFPLVHPHPTLGTDPGRLTLRLVAPFMGSERTLRKIHRFALGANQLLRARSGQVIREMRPQFALVQQTRRAFGALNVSRLFRRRTRRRRCRSRLLPVRDDLDLRFAAAAATIRRRRCGRGNHGNPASPHCRRRRRRRRFRPQRSDHVQTAQLVQRSFEPRLHVFIGNGDALHLQKQF